jgi:toxin ParE1/3/4
MSPERGLLPRELSAVGIQEYRQVFFKPYRVLYRHFDQRLIIYVTADGRRDMQSMLSRRLLGG